MNTQPDTEVLVCGAGPTGLVLALWLTRAGVRVRIVDAAAEPGTTSRALVVHARTLEFYRQLGMSQAFQREGLEFRSVNLWVRGRQVARVELGDIGRGISPFPFMLVVPQDRHERFLVEQLSHAGVAVERGTKLTDFEQDGECVRARLERADGSQITCTAAYLAGCDGARSRTREVLDAGFEGSTYSHVFFVADVDAHGPVMNDQLHVALDESDLLAVFPLLGGKTGRLIGTVRELRDHDGSTLTWEDVGKRSMQRLGIEVERVNWFSTYRVHHRVAGVFQRGRVFLLGDAAHIHSPVGGQGMNTGIGDAVNLGWKLADVLQGRAHASLLASYPPERRAFAQRLVATTDRAFVVATSPGPIARFVRTRVIPLVLPTATRLAAVRRFMFRTVSQTAIHYRASELNAGAAGRLRGGDRLPWVQLGDESADDNFAALADRKWQVHVYGEAAPGIEEACRRLDLPLHVFPWRAAMQRSKLTKDALYLVRPDGYIALADADARRERLEQFVTALRDTVTSR